MCNKLKISQLTSLLFFLFVLAVSTTGYAQTGIHDSGLEGENGSVMVFVPNAFTPNGDELNQEFLPVFGGSFDAENYHLTVFNRWGETVFESRNASIGWDGTYGGKLALEGQYAWTIRYKHLNNDGYEVLNGHVTIFR